jgi:hypothetical protein
MNAIKTHVHIHKMHVNIHETIQINKSLQAKPINKASAKGHLTRGQQEQPMGGSEDQRQREIPDHFWMEWVRNILLPRKRNGFPTLFKEEGWKLAFPKDSCGFAPTIIQTEQVGRGRVGPLGVWEGDDNNKQCKRCSGELNILTNSCNCLHVQGRWISWTI